MGNDELLRRIDAHMERGNDLMERGNELMELVRLEFQQNRSASHAVRDSLRELTVGVREQRETFNAEFKGISERFKDMSDHLTTQTQALMAVLARLEGNGPAPA